MLVTIICMIILACKGTITLFVTMTIGNFKGGPAGHSPPAKNLVVENLDKMLTYALALLNQVFLAHKHVFLGLF